MIATRYYDEELLGQLSLLDDIHWLFARGGMGQFIEMKDHTYGVIGGIITSIARFLGVEPNPDDRVSGSEWLDKTIFELMSFYLVEGLEARRLY